MGTDKRLSLASAYVFIYKRLKLLLVLVLILTYMWNDWLDPAISTSFIVT